MVKQLQTNDRRGRGRLPSKIKIGTDVWACALGFQGSTFAWVLGFAS